MPKKIQKTKKHNPGLILSINGSGRTEKVGNCFPRSEPFLPDLSLRIPKKIAKKFKKLKNIILASFITVFTEPVLENSQKIAKK